MDEKQVQTGAAAVNAEAKTVFQKLSDTKWGGLVLLVSHLIAFGVGIVLGLKF